MGDSIDPVSQSELAICLEKYGKYFDTFELPTGKIHLEKNNNYEKMPIDRILLTTNGLTYIESKDGNIWELTDVNLKEIVATTEQMALDPDADIQRDVQSSDRNFSLTHYALTGDLEEVLGYDFDTRIPF